MTLTAQESRDKRLATAKTWRSRIDDLDMDYTVFARHAKMGETRVSQILGCKSAPHPKTVKRMEAAIEKLEKRKKK